jgi:hypothetical protein
MVRCNLQEHDDPMAASIHDLPFTTYLTPGQRFESADLFGADTGPVTVSRLVRDTFGMMHVTLRTGTGREISAFVQQIEMAITDGHLIPVDSPTTPVAC